MQKIILILTCMLSLAFTAIVQAQTIQGLTNVSLYSSHTYSYSISQMAYSPHWRLNHLYGTITSQWNNGYICYVTITWHTAGIENLAFFNGSALVSEVTIT